jgi:hypothetical protein
MKALKEFIGKIVESKEGFKLGEPWKFNKNSMGVIIPIQRENVLKRNYTTLPEVKDTITFKDTGNIQTIQIEKGVNIPLFIRAGTMLKGIMGKDRATVHSIIVEPKKSMDLEVRCVHASRGIVTGGGFTYDGYAPNIVYQSLNTGNQSKVWNSVGRTYSCMKEKSIGAFAVSDFNLSNVKSDSLPEIKEAMKKLDTKFQDILLQVPVLENQIGAIIVATNGVSGLEVFDHPDSWKAQYKEVIEKYSDDLSQESQLFTFDETQVMAVVRTFLKKVADSSSSEIHKGIYSLNVEGFIGEYATIKEQVLHLFLLKKDEKDNNKEEIPIAYPSFHFENHLDDDSTYHKRIGTLASFQKKGFNAIEKTINKYGGATWSELEKESKVSTATLTKRLKEGKQLGLIGEEIRRTNGKKVYTLNSNYR